MTNITYDDSENNRNKLNPSISKGFEKENYIASKSMGVLLPEKPQTVGKKYKKEA